MFLVLILDQIYQLIIVLSNNCVDPLFFIEISGFSVCFTSDDKLVLITVKWEKR